ncbi:MAG: hypothetical protein V4538_07965 [Bacteroidota bacterium]
MKVREAFPHPSLDNHEIQIGVSTWTENNPVDEQTESIRRAVYNEEGKFSPHGSSEIPIEDMTLLIRACIQRDRIGLQEMSDILNDISASMERQS